MTVEGNGAAYIYDLTTGALLVRLAPVDPSTGMAYTGCFWCVLVLPYCLPLPLYRARCLPLPCAAQFHCHVLLTSLPYASHLCCCLLSSRSYRCHMLLTSAATSLARSYRCRFGAAVALSNGIAVVGAPRARSPCASAVLAGSVFTYANEVGGGFNQTAQLEPHDVLE